jgi:hypothetical protein
MRGLWLEPLKLLKLMYPIEKTGPPIDGPLKFIQVLPFGRLNTISGKVGDETYHIAELEKMKEMVRLSKDERLTKERSEFVPMCDTQQGQRIAL